MDTSNLPPKPLSTWKRLAIISLFGGAGLAFMAGLILGGAFWYTSRPAPPKPWNTTVIVAKGPPGFSVSKDGKTIDFGYVLGNVGSSDYHIDSISALQIMIRRKDGSLSEPLPDKEQILRLPVFVPTGQQAEVQLSFPFSDLPTGDTGEFDAAFHDRVRSYLNQKSQQVSGFVLFDSTNHYEIDLPKWLSEAPKEKTP